MTVQRYRRRPIQLLFALWLHVLPKALHSPYSRIMRRTWLKVDSRSFSTWHLKDTGIDTNFDRFDQYFAHYITGMSTYFFLFYSYIEFSRHILHKAKKKDKALSYFTVKTARLSTAVMSQGMRKSNALVRNHPNILWAPINGTPSNFVIKLATLRVETFAYYSTKTACPETFIDSHQH